IVVCDSRGVVHVGRSDLNAEKVSLASVTNPRQVAGTIADALRGADVLIGVSGGTIDEPALAGMNPGGVIFALANPEPEVQPTIAARYAAVVATGRSDYPNQINNVLASPGVFRGLLDAQARNITDDMLVAAANAIADVVDGDRLNPSFIVPSVFDSAVAPAVAEAVSAV